MKKKAFILDALLRDGKYILYVPKERFELKEENSDFYFLEVVAEPQKGNK